MARAAWAVAAAALLTSGALMARNSSLKADNDALSQRLSEAESEIAALQRVASRGIRDRPEVGRPRRPMEPPAPSEPTAEALLAELPPEELLSTPGVEHQLQAAVQEQVKAEIGNRRAEWMERRRAELGESIAAYADDTDMSDETREEVVAVMDDALEVSADILRARREDQASPEEAQQAMNELRESVFTDLTELLGAEEAEAFIETVHGPMKSPFLQ